MISAIVYNLENLYAKSYAETLSIATDLPMFSISDAKKYLPKNSSIIFLSEVMRNKLVHFDKVKRGYNVIAIGAITGEPLEENRKTKIMGASGVKCKNTFCLSSTVDMYGSSQKHEKQIKLMAKLIKERPSVSSRENYKVCEPECAEYRRKNLGDLLSWYKLTENGENARRRVFC